MSVDERQPDRTFQEELPSARLLAGKYRLGRLIGEGGMGAVYEAEHTGLGAHVAVKILSEGGVVDEKALSRFRREARAMGAIRHDNVVAVMDTGTDEDGTPFLVMEHLEGESLSAVLRRAKVLPARSAVNIAAQLLSGLAAAHSRGITHRDLKPGNVFVTRQADGSERVKILDFGVSKLGDAMRTLNVTADGVLVGTPNFMAPEQVEGRADVDARADLYAAGVLLYRMVTGRLPYAASSSEELYRRILTGAAAPPRALRPDLSESLEAVIRKAMQPDRAQRYATAQEFRMALLAATPDLARGGLDLCVLPDPGAVPVPRKPPPPATGIPVGPDDTTRPARRSSLAETAGPSITLHTRPHRAHWFLLAALLFAVAAPIWAWWLTSRDDNPASARVMSGPPLRIGVIRYLPENMVEHAHAPLIAYLQRELDRPVELVVALDHDELAELLLSKRVEVAALSPYNYVRSKNKAAGLRLLAAPVAPGGTLSYEGLILTRADSGVEQLEDLRGKVFCFVDPGSSSGYLYPRAILRRAGINPDKDLAAVHFGGDHLATLRLLARGNCEGAAVYAGILYQSDQHGMPAQGFRVLASTNRIPADAYCAPPDLEEAEVDKLRGALLALAPNSPLAKEVLESADAPFVGFTAVQDSAYDSVRDLVRDLDLDSKVK
jgi:phosphate/phosphite/phosphonate ABC transporter binding protein